MLPFAQRVSRHTGDIFEIQLPARHGRRARKRLMDMFSPAEDAIMGFEDAINGLAGGERELEELQSGITL